MKEIVGIQFKNASRVYYFSPLEYKFSVGEYAIVETVRGLELGKVIIANRMVEDDELSHELKPVVRKANQHDLILEKKHEEMAPESFAIFKKYVNELNLPMKPLYCEYTIDSSKIIFYYSAEERVDFRELLKLLTPHFKTRVELRQIGPREAARVVGGIGSCGRVICCKTCLNNFDFVTMKMAKEQGMSLNTNKISGVCGKLMCCIGYEHELYLELKKEVPNVGQLVKTPNCSCCKVVNVDYIKKIVSVQENQDGAPVKYEAKQVSLIVPKDPNAPDCEEIVSSDDIEEVVEAQQEEVVETKEDKSKKKIYKPFIKNNNNNNKKKKNKKNDNKK